MWGEDHIPGFVKALNPCPLFWDFAGENQEERLLNILEEQILSEGTCCVQIY